MNDSLPISAENQAVLQNLARALELAEGFTLLFARCNLPAQRDDLLARLSLQGHTLQRLDVTPQDNVIARLLEENARAPRAGSLHVCNLETQMPYGDPHPPILERLNLTRNTLRLVDRPIVFWLREEALTCLARGAPDFWAWRSGVFEFMPEPAWAEAVYHQPRGGTLEWQELPETEKSQRILTLEGLVADYRSLGAGEAERHGLAELLLELGQLYLRSYRIPSAQMCLEEALDLYRAGGDRLGEADVLQAMGDVFSFRDERDAALDAYRQALDLYRAVGARLGEANVLQAMGDVFSFRKQNDAALDAYRQALDLYRAVGARLGEANVLASLGRFYVLEQPERAEQFLDQAITIYQAIGDRYSVAAQVGNFGWTLRRLGAEARARPYLLRAAELFEALGLTDYAERHYYYAKIDTDEP